MPSYLSQASVSNSMPTIHSQQKSLEHENKQLEQMLKEKQQSLTLQLKIIKSKLDESSKDSSLILIEQFLSKQGQIRSFFTEKLIKRQIKIEQAKQMNEIIINYQKRIMDLRGVLINKEGEISALSFQFLRGTITRRQNLQAINCETLEKIALNKYAKERKKLIVEIEALEYTINELKKNRQRSKRRSEVKQKCQGQKRQTPLMKEQKQKDIKMEVQQINPMGFKWQKDLLTDKVIKLMQQQTVKYEEQQTLLEKLKLEFQQVEKQEQENIKKYKKSQQQWSKMLLINDQILASGQNKNPKQLSFIKELEQQMSNANSEVLNSQLFSSIDTNKIQSHNQVSKSFKHNLTATSLTEKRRKTLKEN